MAAHVLSDLQSIVRNQLLTHHEQEAAIVELVHRRQASSILALLLSLHDASNECFLAIVELLNKFLDAFDGSITSPELPDFLSAVQRRNSNPIASCVMEMLKWDLRKNLAGASTGHKENIDAIFQFCVGYLLGYDLQVAERAAELIRTIIASDVTLLRSLIASSKPFIAANSGEGNIILLRVYSLVSEFVQKEEEAMATAEEAGFAEALLNLCKSDDILAQVNAVELLSSLACTEAGLQALVAHGAIQWLVQVIAQAVEADATIQDEALRCLGKIFSCAAQRSTLFVEHVDPGTVNMFLSTLLWNLTEGNESDKIVSLAVLSDFMAISLAALRCVMTFKDGALVQAWMKLLSSSKPELQGAALRSIGMVLEQPDDLLVKNELRPDGGQTASRSLFSSGPEEDTERPSPETMHEHVRRLKQDLVQQIQASKRNAAVTYLVYSAKQPVHMIKYPAMQVLAALAAQPAGWGLQLLFQSASTESAMLECDFFVFLTNRLTESTKEGKDLKFSLIQAVARHPMANNFPPEVKRQLHVMIAQGAYYMPPAMEELQTL